MTKLRVFTPPVVGATIALSTALFGSTAGASEEKTAADVALPTSASEPLSPSSAALDEDSDPSAYDVPGEFIVDARDDLSEADLLTLARDYDLAFKPTALESETKAELARASGGVLSQVIAKLSRDPRVEVVEPLAYVRASFTADDPLLSEQWHLDRVGAPRAWDFATGRGVTVAVVDTGIACETYGPYKKGSDLAATACVGGWNFVTRNAHANDDQGHGTHVAGTIAQSTNNGIGAAGMAFNARLMPVKVLNENGWGTTADVADGIRWAAEHGAQVINLSLGGPRNSRVLQKAIDFARSKGVVVVAAAGNTGGRVQYPGASAGVIGVSATDPDDKIARFSSRGDGVDIAAPGVNVVQQTVCNKGRDQCERYAGYSGTSMASPHVAGAAALLVGLGVTDPAHVEAALKQNARVVDTSKEGKGLYGAGILSAAKAVEAVTLRHALVRLVTLLGLSLFLLRGLRKKAPGAKLGFSYWLPAMAAGPSVLFFLPWILPRVHLAADLLASPIADFDFLAGVTVHRWLPLANAAIPFALTAIGFGSRRLRAPIAGLSAGTAAYLLSVVLLHDVKGPFGSFALTLWCVANAVVCLWIARTNLVARASSR